MPGAANAAAFRAVLLSGDGVTTEGAPLAALLMFEEGANFFARERTREPLHVVLHEHLDRGALDRATALDRGVDATADRHVRAQQDF